MITATFTDPQGQTWTDAKLKVINYSVNINSNISKSHNNMENPNENSEVSANFNMQVVYWPTIEAFNAGYSAYSLKNLENNSMATDNFRFSSSIAPATQEQLEQACEEYLETVLIPPMV